ncbi:MAG: HAMP domain-containing protein [Deferribacteres bacterium]|nr:HAMP domain-containing protein [candidate division KSB1 bacterium]MCB9511084.1 HAMP domain-containing protein [Deferribacteres bacterium]
MKIKISHKLIVAVGGVTVVIIAIFAYININSQQKALILQVEHSAHQLSETVKSSTKYDMMLNQREHILRTINDIGQQEGIQKVRIFNKIGEIVYSNAHDEIGRTVDKQAEACDKCHAGIQPLPGLSLHDRTRIFPDENNANTLGIINPIYNEQGCWQASCHAHARQDEILGVLDVTMSLGEVEEQIAANEKKMLLFAISAILVISALLWFLVQQLVGKPVNQLVKATNVVATGNLSYQIPSHSDDELGDLGRSFNDMTSKLEDAQKKVYHYDKLASLGRLAAGIAHEINNPLTGVLTYSSFLLKRAKDEENRKDLEVIVRETKRCRGIVKDLLDFARPEPVKKTGVAINQVVDRAIHIMESNFRQNNLDIRLSLQPNLPEVIADANQLQQVLINLLVNAMDAVNSKPDGKLELATINGSSAGQPEVIVKITDNGCGIPRQQLTKIFEPFFSTKGKKGTGLGLAVVWGIIEKHNGKIEVDSEEEIGTTFTIRLPATEVAQAAILESSEKVGT